MNPSFFITRIVYLSRWIMLLFFSGLILSLCLFGFYYVQKLYKLFINLDSMGSEEVILNMLSMIDITLIASLIMMVLISGYDSFLAKFSSLEGTNPMDDLTHVSSGAIKLKISTAIIVISSIYILEIVMDLPKFKPEDISWTLIMHGTLLATGLVLALIENISHQKSDH